MSSSDWGASGGWEREAKPAHVEFPGTHQWMSQNIQNKVGLIERCAYISEDAKSL